MIIHDFNCCFIFWAVYLFYYYYLCSGLLSFNLNICLIFNMQNHRHRRSHHLNLKNSINRAYCIVQNYKFNVSSFF